MKPTKQIRTVPKDILYISVFFFFALIHPSVQAKDLQAVPKTEGLRPALILLHDYWGQDTFVKNEAKRFAQLGYFTVSVDYYDGKTPTDLQEADRLKEGIIYEKTLNKIGKVFTALAANAKVDKTKIGILGWGIGATYALKFTLQKPEVKTLVMIYGLPITDVGDLSKIKGDLLVIFPEKDDRVSPGSIAQFKKDLDQAHARNEVHTIKASTRGFFDYSRSATYSPSASGEGKKIITSFLNRHLALTEYSK